jgi:hypothetical protein
VKDAQAMSPSNRLLDPFWVELALQGTRTYRTELEIQRDFLVGLSIHEVKLIAHVFNWGWDDPLLVFSIGIHF